MRAIPSAFGGSSRRRIGEWAIALFLLLLTACDRPSNPDQPITLRLYQTWELQPGDRLGNYQILGGLGDLSIGLRGGNVYAPVAGNTQLDQRQCIIFSSPEIPAYRFRFCGLVARHLGDRDQGSVIGHGRQLQFATLRKQPNGTWALVEPARSFLERSLVPKHP